MYIYIYIYVRALSRPLCRYVYSEQPTRSASSESPEKFRVTRSSFRTIRSGRERKLLNICAASKCVDPSQMPMVHTW